MTLPPFMNLRQLATDPHQPRGDTRWAVRCTGCRTNFYATARDRADVETPALIHLRNEHGGSHA